MPEQTLLDLIIIGSGPAGLTALLYASLYKLNTLCIGSDTGGKVKLAPGIIDYPGVEEINGKDFINHLLAQIKKANGQIKIDEVIQIYDLRSHFQVKTRNNFQIDAKYILFATGNPQKQPVWQSEQLVKALQIETIDKFLAVDHKYRTNHKQIYAAGECIYYPFSMEQLATTVASAITATAMIYEDLKGEKPPILWGEAQIRRF